MPPKSRANLWDRKPHNLKELKKFLFFENVITSIHEFIFHGKVLRCFSTRFRDKLNELKANLKQIKEELKELEKEEVKGKGGSTKSKSNVSHNLY